MFTCCRGAIHRLPFRPAAIRLGAGPKKGDQTGEWRAASAGEVGSAPRRPRAHRPRFARPWRPQDPGPKSPGRPVDMAPVPARWHASEDARGARLCRLEAAPTPPARRAQPCAGAGVCLGGETKVESYKATKDDPSIASSSARGRAGAIRRDVRRRFERSENASRRPSPSRTRIARPKMDVPGGALPAIARRKPSGRSPEFFSQA